MLLERLGRFSKNFIIIVKFNYDIHRINSDFTLADSGFRL